MGVPYCTPRTAVKVAGEVLKEHGGGELTQYLKNGDVSQDDNTLTLTKIICL